MAPFSKLPKLYRMQVERPLEILWEGNEHTRGARREIDDNISKLEHKIRILKTRRNKLSPISDLPPEVLSKIFILVRDSFIGFQYRGHEAYWIYVGHVCHHWREVALSCPSLWSVPVFTRPDLAQEMMRRSKMAPLAVISAAATWTPRMLEELENTMGQISRIRSIDFTMASYSKEMKVILSLLSRPAPLLQEVTFSDTTYRAHSFPADALSNAPHLRSVSFDRLSWSWESAIFTNRNLTILRLKDNRAETIEGTSTINQMINSFDHLPNLRILELLNSIPSHTTSSGDEKTLEFKFLEQLALSDEALCCIAFLRRIRYPSHTTIKLCSSLTEVEHCITILSIIGRNFNLGTPYLPPRVIRSAWLTSVSHTTDFFFSDDIERAVLVDSYCNVNPIAHIQFSGSRALDQERDRLLRGASSCFDLSSLEALSLFWTACNDETQNILGNLPKLECLRVSAACLDTCFVIAETPEYVSVEKPVAAITHHFPYREETKAAFPPLTAFPALKTLVVEGGDFRQRRYRSKMECLIDTLAKRSGMNVPVCKLRLERCYGVGDPWRKRLREFVAHLEVEENICLRKSNYDSDLPLDEGGESSEESDEGEPSDEYMTDDSHE